MSSHDFDHVSKIIRLRHALRQKFSLAFLYQSLLTHAWHISQFCQTIDRALNLPCVIGGKIMKVTRGGIEHLARKTSPISLLC